MTWQSPNAYLESEILTADPIQLTKIVYDLGVTSLQRARQCCRAGDIAGRGKHVNKTLDVLVELSQSLDFEQGGEIAKNYARLYDYCQRRLLQAHVEQSEHMLAEVQHLLEELREAWDVVIKNHSMRCLPVEDSVRAGAPSEESRFSCTG
jgi:flagellar secretion chaperone FliS